MGFMSNHSLSQRSMIRSRNQDDGYSVRHVKWKPCKVFAVRNFPPGCGPIVDQPVNLGSQEANTSSSWINHKNQVNDTGTVESQVESLCHGMPKSTEDERLIVERGNNKAMLKDEISGPVNAVVEVDDIGGSVIKESLQKMIYRKIRVFRVRDFPPYCGLNANEPTEEERKRINGKRSFEIEDEMPNGKSVEKSKKRRGADAEW